MLQTHHDDEGEPSDADVAGEDLMHGGVEQPTLDTSASKIVYEYGATARSTIYLAARFISGSQTTLLIDNFTHIKREDCTAGKLTLCRHDAMHGLRGHII